MDNTIRANNSPDNTLTETVKKEHCFHSPLFRKCVATDQGVWYICQHCSEAHFKLYKDIGE